MTQNDLWTALRDCFDNTLRCNIVDLGAVLQATLQEDTEAPGYGIAGVPSRYHATVQLALTNQEEIAQSQLVAQIQNRLAGLPTLSGSTVAIDTTVPWTPERITPEGRKILGLDRGPQGPQLIQIKLP